MSTMPFAAIDSFVGNFPDPQHMVSRPCPVCGADDARTVLVLEDFQFFSDSDKVGKRADIYQVRCRNCQALYMNPCYGPSGFETLFREAGMTYGASAMRHQEQRGWLQQRALLYDGATVLDVGCYTGAFIAMLPETVNTVGVDIDPAVIAKARARFQGQAHRTFIPGDFEHFVYDGQVDVITMFHVLEHLANPKAVLRKLRRMAHESTRLVVEVPILEKGATNDINGYLTVSHLTHFSVRTLEMVMAECGWRVVDATPMDYNGYRVLAEPVGDLPIPTPEFGDFLILQRYLSHWRDALAAASERMGAARADQCVIWGGGFHTELIYQLTHFFQLRPARRYVIVDIDPLKQGQTWRGVPIHSPEIIEQVDWSKSELLISSYGSQETIAADAVGRGVPESQILRLYDEITRY